MEVEAGFPIGLVMILGLGGLVVLGGVFALIYWLADKGKDDGA